MCRMIAARGDFDPDAVFRACQLMSCGYSAEHETQRKQHPDGWGAMWIDTRDGVQIHRSLSHVRDDAPPQYQGKPSFLAFHAKERRIP